MRVKLFLILLSSILLRITLSVELGTSLENADAPSEHITPIRTIIKRKKPINLNELPSTSDDSDEEEKSLRKKAKDDNLEPANELTIKQIKKIKRQRKISKRSCKTYELIS